MCKGILDRINRIDMIVERVLLAALPWLLGAAVVCFAVCAVQQWCRCDGDGADVVYPDPVCEWCGVVLSEVVTNICDGSEDRRCSVDCVEGK